MICFYAFKFLSAMKYHWARASSSATSIISLYARSSISFFPRTAFRFIRSFFSFKPLTIHQAANLTQHIRVKCSLHIFYLEVALTAISARAVEFF